MIDTSWSSAPNPMVFNFPTGSKFELDRRVMFYEGELGDGLLKFIDARTGSLVQIVDPVTGASKLPDVAWLIDLMRRGKCRRFDTVEEAKVRRHRPQYDHDAIIKRDAKAALRRFVVLQLIARKSPFSDNPISEHLDQIWRDPAIAKRYGPRPATTSARRWYRKMAERETIRLIDTMSMSGRVPRSSTARIDPVVRTIIQWAARYYYTDKGIKIKDACSNAEKLIREENERRKVAGGVELPLKMASRSTISRAIHDIRSFDTVAEKFGASFAKRYFKVAGSPLHTQRHLEIALADDKFWDSVCVFHGSNRLPIGRPWLCVIMDVHTRCILGWRVSFEGPTLHSAIETFKHASRPKAPTDRSKQYPVLERIGGQIATLIADNGANFVSAAFEDALLDVGTTLQLAAVRTPTHKAMLERFFRTLDTLLSAKLPGAMLDPSLMAEMGYDPVKDSALTLAELDELITEAIGVYHVQDHSALGMQPARAWELSEAAHGTNIIENPHALDHLLGSTKRARLTKNGINLEGLFYRDPTATYELLNDLAGLQKVGDRLRHTASAWVKIRFNEANLAEIHAWNDRTKAYVRIPSCQPRYTEGLSLFQHRQIKAWAKREARAFNSEEDQLGARQALNDLIHKLAPDLEMRDRRAMARMFSSDRLQRYQPSMPVPVETVVSNVDATGHTIQVSTGASVREDGAHLPPRPTFAPEKSRVATPLDASIESAARGPDDDWDDIDVDSSDDHL
ncbi:DDE-type integrase/transposase/recombinase [Sphingomonas sp. PR090111-T3T-6A]|uniref:DDE-type integrase/transposase/recombinase n=1 Tax=Sphingomonas sp. PR090111-T3T-6A TaxID=685778 RepID=UPI000365BE72|nr:DDE-type integrase/transposase/recombinase [Sphingomonas sp. PR090111-T3T-6A]